MSEYEREMWEELYAIRSRVESIEEYMKQILNELMKINRALSASQADPSLGGLNSPGGGKSALSVLSDKFKRK
jgi:hypothetical protein